MADPLSFEDVTRAILEADAAGAPVPPLDDQLVRYLGEGPYGLPPGLDAAIQRFEPARRDAFTAKLREALRGRDTAFPIPVSLGRYLNDPAFDQHAIDAVVRNIRYALERDNLFRTSYRSLSSLLEEWLGGGTYAAGLLDRTLAELDAREELAGHVGAQVRLLLRRVRFTALRGTDRPLSLALPDGDVRWIETVEDGISKRDALAGLSAAEIDELCTAWSALDWDETLRVEELFGRRVPQPSIEERDWAELVALVEQTSLKRLECGERDHRSLTRLFGRPEPLDVKIALAERLAAFAKQYPKEAWEWAMAAVLLGLVPVLVQAGRPLTGTLESLARTYLAEDHPDRGELRDLLIQLPRPQVDGWLAKLRTSKVAKSRRLAAEYDAKLAAS
ncbi:MAG: hypothetical protein ACTHU0_32080 [Kofleriaceae bacterium]